LNALLKDQADLEKDLISIRLTADQINQIEKEMKNIDNNIQSLKKDYEDNLKKIQESVEIKEEEFFIIMKQAEDLKDEFITKVYSEY
jgi:predicted  nucleic acid-binding Zn-ribbon protein